MTRAMQATLAPGAMVLACTGPNQRAGSPAARSDLQIEVAATSDTMIWNAVAVVGGRIFVAGPRWTGSQGPQLAEIGAGGTLRPYPDAAWNAWRQGADPTHAFVDINALHLDRDGSLCVVDTGGPEFGGDPLPGGAKLVCFTPASGTVSRLVPFGPEIAKAGSYVDDVRFGRDHAYLSDAGAPGLIVVDLATGAARRALDGHASVRAPANRDIVVDGQIVKAPSGQPLRVNVDPFELSPDGAWLYYGPLEGPWSRIATRLLNDPNVNGDELTRNVEPWADLPPVGGTVMGPSGDLYFTDLAADALKRRAPDGTITTLVTDPRLHWVDAPFLGRDGTMWLPVPQMDRVALFNGGVSKIERPVKLMRIRVL
ncbi:MAG: SMP-30/gluconolactonase/LRE family protein [Polyangiaceae bacterium]